MILLLYNMEMQKNFGREDLIKKMGEWRFYLEGWCEERWVKKNPNHSPILQ